jgi:hypothetical protein
LGIVAAFAAAAAHVTNPRSSSQRRNRYPRNTSGGMNEECRSSGSRGHRRCPVRARAAQLMRQQRAAAGCVAVLSPPKAKVARSNRVGSASNHAFLRFFRPYCRSSPQLSPLDAVDSGEQGRPYPSPTSRFSTSDDARPSMRSARGTCQGEGSLVIGWGDTPVRGWPEGDRR